MLFSLGSHHQRYNEVAVYHQNSFKSSSHLSSLFIMKYTTKETLTCVFNTVGLESILLPFNGHYIGQPALAGIPS